MVTTTDSEIRCRRLLTIEKSALFLCMRTRELRKHGALGDPYVLLRLSTSRRTPLGP